MTPRHPSAVRRVVVPLAVFAAFMLVGTSCTYTWLQFAGSGAHSGNNTAETTLTVTNVATLHRVWQASMFSAADGAPAYVPSVATASGTKSLVFVTGRNGDVVALDASNGAQVWKRSFTSATCKINNGSTACYTTSSPAVDPKLQFVFSYGLDGSVHKLAIGTGVETTTGGWPELVTTKGFDEKGSSALSIATANSGVSYLYMVTAGYPGDLGDYQGHLVTVNLATGAQKVFNTLCSNQTVHFVTTPGSPDCPEVQSGVWARVGTVYDKDNDRLFISSGNGTFAPASHHWGDTVLALHPDGSAANANGDPIDSYTPTNFQFLDSSDQDLGSTLLAILPTPASSNVKRLGVQGGKDANLRLIDLDDMSRHGTPQPGNTGGEVGALLPVPQGGQTLTQPTVWVNPADSSTWVFVGNNSGTSALKLVVTAGNPSLVLQWKNTTTTTTPLVANNVLYLAAGTRVGAYNPLTGANLWQDTTLSSLHWQTPVVANGMLLIEDGAGHVNAYVH